MKILLDTRILIWMHTNDRQLSRLAKAMLSDLNHTVYYSTVSLWEAEVKHDAHPKRFPFTGDKLRDLSDRADLLCLPLLPEHISMLHDTDAAAKDPFTNLLLAQAKAASMQFMTTATFLPPDDAVLAV